MSAPVKKGDVLAGKYLVDRVLGAGGMGVVVAARHMQLDEQVAIKFLLPESLKEPSVVTRFMREGKAASKIHSEHVARVNDVGTLENGAPYIVMEFLEGSDLAALVKAQGPLDIPTAVEYTLQTCEAIAEAHSLGIIHRDIKPSNLFVTSRSDGTPVVKVIDFGISKMTASTDQGMDITKTAEMRGSLLFISPEQMISPRSVDPRSDIWSIGVSLHHLLTGSYPFRASNVPELCAMILQREPVPLRAARSNAPTGLDACILRCLKKKPEDRYSNVAELAEDLAKFAPPYAGQSVTRIRRILDLELRRGRSSLPSITTAEHLVHRRDPRTSVSADSSIPATREGARITQKLVSENPPVSAADSLNVGLVSVTGETQKKLSRSLAFSAVIAAVVAGVVMAVIAVVELKLREDNTRGRPIFEAGEAPKPAVPSVPAAARPLIVGDNVGAAPSSSASSSVTIPAVHTVSPPGSASPPVSATSRKQPLSGARPSATPAPPAPSVTMEAPPPSNQKPPTVLF